MVLAAGFGTRLMPLTGEISKPMVPIVNRPVMEHLLLLLARCGFTDVMANTHYQPQGITGYFGDGSHWNLNLNYSHEEDLLGTAGGVKNVESFFGGNTLVVLSGDSLTDADLGELLAFHRRKKALATIMVTPVQETSRYGVVLTDDEDLIVGFQEKPPDAEALSNVANSGVYVLEPEVLEMIPAGQPYDFGRELFPLMVDRRDALYAWRHDYYWNDVGSIEEYQRSNFDALEGRVKVEMPGVEIAPGIWVGRDTHINKNVLLTPPVCIGDRCMIEKHARLIGPVVVGPDTVVSAGAVLHRGIKWGGGYIGRDVSMVGSIIGSKSRIGDRAAVLNGAVLGSGCVVKDGIVIHHSVKIKSGTIVDSTSQE
jgi:mannose-1-phosphate guanylyltransferase/phosphomannomutase